MTMTHEYKVDILCIIWSNRYDAIILVYHSLMPVIFDGMTAALLDYSRYEVVNDWYCRLTDNYWHDS